MSLTSYSDLNQERIIARENWHRCPHSRSSQRSKGKRNSKDLKEVGALFQANPKRPETLEITDDEGSFQRPDRPSKLLKALHGSQPECIDPSSPGVPPPTPRLTPTQGAAYLPPHEMPELARQRSDPQTTRNRDRQQSEVSPSPRGRSPCTTIYGADDEQAPDQRDRQRTPFSTRYTPSHHSVSDHEEETHSVGEGPVSPRPWSPYNRNFANNGGSDEE